MGGTPVRGAVRGAVRAHMGTINDTFLTVHYAKSRGLKVLGVIMNLFDPTVDDPTTPSNVPMVERTCDVPVFGRLPFQPEADNLDDVLNSCNSCIDFERLLDAFGVAVKG